MSLKHQYSEVSSLQPAAPFSNQVLGGQLIAETLVHEEPPQMGAHSEAKAPANMPDFSPTESSRQCATGTYTPGNAGPGYLCAAGRIWCGTVPVPCNLVDSHLLRAVSSAAY